MKRISIQKIFNLISIVFLTSCTIFYGTRFVLLYIENNKKEVVEANTLGKEIKNKYQDSLKTINNEYYLNGEITNNYVTYSGITWQVMKIGEDNTVTLVTSNSITSLAFGKSLSYSDSYINNWLNETEKASSGILEKNLNNLTSYLGKREICTDTIDDTDNITCNNTNSEYYITLLSISDYINTGASNGFINTEEYFYLANTTSENKVWYVNSEGKINTNNGEDIYGVKAVITLKPNMELTGGTGSITEPYTIETSLGLLGSYVKLDEDLWQIIGSDGDNIKLMYTDYLKDESGVNLEYKYSSKTSYHDDTVYGTLAYYLKHTFLENKSYKDIVLEVNYANGYYGVDNSYDYSQTLNTTINTKVACISIGDIIINHELSNYFTLTSSSSTSNSVYVIENDNIPYRKNIATKAYVVPVITIKKDNLTIGTGTITDPLRSADYE